MTTTTELIERYFATAPKDDTGAYVALFAPDATVEDEGVTHHGLDGIRSWRTDVPRVSYRVLDVRDEGDEHATVVEISGEFPGSPVTLVFRFTFDGRGLVKTLTIRA